MNSQTARDAGVDLLEEPQHVLGGVTLLAVGQHLTGRDVHRREQIGGPVPLVVMGHRAGPTRHHRQARLGAVQCLTLGLLVEAEHHGPTWGLQVQPDHIDQFLLKARVVRYLECLDPPGLEVVIGSDPGDGVLADPEPCGQGPGGPVRRGISGLLMAGDPHDLGHHSFRQAGMSTPGQD